MKILFGNDAKKNYDTVLVCLSNPKKLSAKAKLIDSEAKGLLSVMLENDQKFKAKYGQTMVVPMPKAAAYKRAIIVGLGELDSLTDVKIRQLGGKVQQALKAASAEVTLYMHDKKTDIADEKICLLLEGVLRRNYSFDKYKTKKKDDDSIAIKSMSVDAENMAEVKKAYAHTEALVKGVEFTRDLVSMPPNDLYPESFAKIVEKELKPLGVKVKIVDYKKLEKMGAGAILAVGKGSSRKPCFAVLEYNGSGKKTSVPDLALVGKGITFDTGGNNIKTSNMHWMLFDMGGAGIVAGTMKSLALSKSKKHVVAVLCLAENMLSGEAYRPSDIITSLSGQTIEVLNTDAEGRLAMCDGMTYVQNHYKPKKMIDVATLTGACMVALGNEYAGAFTPVDTLWKSIEAAGSGSADKVWRMPMDEAWDKEMKSHHADIKNIGDGAFAGASTAAAFLKCFVQDGVEWAHLDVAGVVWAMKPGELWDKGATGYGVDLLDNLIGSL